MKGGKCEFLIVGSGAGGATLAKELSQRHRNVLVVERGKYEERIGTFRDALNFFDTNKLTKTPAKSNEGVILWRTLMAGGSTVVSCGNASRCLKRELEDFGVTLDEKFIEAEKEMNVCPLGQDLMSETSEKMMWASRELGYKMERMPKFIDPTRCKKCGRCVLGCAQGAKWTALDYLKEAERNGAEILYHTTVDRVLSSKGKVKGVRVIGPKGKKEIAAEVVILAAGGLGSPVILQRSGIKKAGQGLFVDLFVNTYGVTEGLNQTQEPSMALVDHEFHRRKGFILSPHVNATRMVRFMEIGAKGLTVPTHGLIGIMTKIVDEPVGEVYPNGKVSKPVTGRDWSRLREGSSIAREILIKMGADNRSIMVSRPQGGHPGGAAAIGKIVDGGLQTEIDGLFVCDASVFPESPGMPPILTIVAMSKWLAERLAS